MSGASPHGEADGVFSKVQVKKEIKTIVENLETILGDLKDVAKELKEVVHEIDSLTCDLQLEEDGLTESSKTDTLNSTSSCSTTTTTTASSLEKTKLYPDDYVFRTPAPVAPAPNPPAVLAVLKKPRPPLPPPRLTPPRAEEHNARNLPHPTLVLSGNPSKANGTLLRNGGVFPLAGTLFSSSVCCGGGGGVPEAGPVPTLPRPMPLLRHEKNQCPRAPGREPREPREPRERVRFSEKVQYHGYCPDCDLQYDVDDAALHLRAELSDLRLSPVHCCSSSSSPSPPHHHHTLPHQLMLENGGLPVGLGFVPTAGVPSPRAPPAAPLPPPHHHHQHHHHHHPHPHQHHPPSTKPQKTILRKSTTTTV